MAKRMLSDAEVEKRIRALLGTLCALREAREALREIRRIHTGVGGHDLARDVVRVLEVVRRALGEGT